MTRTNEQRIVIKIDNDKLVMESEQTIELWNGTKLFMSEYQKTMNEIKERIAFLTPKGE